MPTHSLHESFQLFAVNFRHSWCGYRDRTGAVPASTVDCTRIFDHPQTYDSTVSVGQKPPNRPVKKGGQKTVFTASLSCLAQR